MKKVVTDELGIPTQTARKTKSERIDMVQSSSFDLPSRDPSKIPSISRQLITPKLANTQPRGTPQPTKATVEMELAVFSATTRLAPSYSKSSPKVVPKNSGSEKPKELSELI